MKAKDNSHFINEQETEIGIKANIMAGFNNFVFRKRNRRISLRNVETVYQYDKNIKFFLMKRAGCSKFSIN